MWLRCPFTCAVWHVFLLVKTIKQSFDLRKQHVIHPKTKRDAFWRHSAETDSVDLSSELSSLGCGSQPSCLSFVDGCLEDIRVSLLPQTGTNLPAVQEARVRSLGWEDPLEEEMATHSSVLAWRIPMDRGAWWAKSVGSQMVKTLLSN